MRLFIAEEGQPKDDPLLVAAVERGDAAAVRERLAAGAFVDSCHPTGHSNLMIAAVNGQREIFEMLLDAGADPYLKYGEWRARRWTGPPPWDGLRLSRSGCGAVWT